MLEERLSFLQKEREKLALWASDEEPAFSHDPAYDLKPDPLTATTPAAFIETLRQYRAWSGNPSWRAMAQRTGQAVVHATMYNAMNGDALPKLPVVRAIIIGCGGGEDDLKNFTAAWRRIASSNTTSQAADRKPLSAG